MCGREGKKEEEKDSKEITPSGEEESQLLSSESDCSESSHRKGCAEESGSKKGIDKSEASWESLLLLQVDWRILGCVTGYRTSKLTRREQSGETGRSTDYLPI